MMKFFLVLIIFTVLPVWVFGQETDFEYKKDSAKSVKGTETSLFSQDPLSFEGVNKDSTHSSFVLSVSYKTDTLFIAVRYYSMCCQKFITYIEPNEDISQINFVVKSLETNCICVAEKQESYKIYASNLENNVKLRINGQTPKFGITEYLNPNILSGKRKKREKKKS